MGCKKLQVQTSRVEIEDVIVKKLHKTRSNSDVNTVLINVPIQTELLDCVH